MSHFSNALEIALSEYAGTRKSFALNVGIPVSTFHTYYSGKSSPSPADLAKIVEPLDEHTRARLVIAHLRDQIPLNARDIVSVQSLIETPGAMEHAPERKVQLPPDLRADFELLERSAAESPEAADLIRSTARLFRGR
ncbi:MAG TPA: hypothetical protein VHY22_10270 [Chthoniobacteraceae bacterium]|jgi:hypothetical protein|nr:hypothetical protein [Chthoniobacteraceae bacterium]